MTPTCEVQWIDCQGNETTHYTPEPAVAIAVLRSDPSKRLFVCAAHAETATSHKAHHGDCPHVGTRTAWDVLPLVDTSPALSEETPVWFRGSYATQFSIRGVVETIDPDKPNGLVYGVRLENHNLYWCAREQLRVRESEILADTSPAPSPRVQVSHVTGDIRHMGASRRWVLQEIRANGARSVLSNWEGTDEEAFDAVLADPREVFCSCPCVKNPDGSCSGKLQG